MLHFKIAEKDYRTYSKEYQHAFHGKLLDIYFQYKEY